MRSDERADNAIILSLKFLFVYSLLQLPNFWRRRWETLYLGLEIYKALQVLITLLFSLFYPKIIDKQLEESFCFSTRGDPSSKYDHLERYATVLMVIFRAWVTGGSKRQLVNDNLIFETVFEFVSCSFFHTKILFLAE